MEAPAKKYRGFISYSQKDKAFARKLHAALESYVTPRGVSSPLMNQKTRRLGRFFRDDDEMGASSDLGEALRGAIKDSDALIVICSPRAAKSPWVNQEIVHFKLTGRAGRVFGVIIDGEPNASASTDPRRQAAECFPAALRFDVNPDGTVSDRPDEPLAIDLRKEPFAKVISRLAAGLLNVGFDDLWRRAQRRSRQRMAAGLSVAGAALAGAVVAGVVVVNSLNFAEAEGKRREVAETDAEKARAERLAAQTDLELARIARLEAEDQRKLALQAEADAKTAEASAKTAAAKARVEVIGTNAEIAIGDYTRLDQQELETPPGYEYAPPSTGPNGRPETPDERAAREQRNEELRTQQAERAAIALSEARWRAATLVYAAALASGEVDQLRAARLGYLNAGKVSLSYQYATAHLSAGWDKILVTGYGSASSDNDVPLVDGISASLVDTRTMTATPLGKLELRDDVTVSPDGRYFVVPAASPYWEAQDLEKRINAAFEDADISEFDPDKLSKDLDIRPIVQALLKVDPTLDRQATTRFVQRKFDEAWFQHIVDSFDGEPRDYELEEQIEDAVERGGLILPGDIKQVNPRHFAEALHKVDPTLNVKKVSDYVQALIDHDRAPEEALANVSRWTDEPVPEMAAADIWDLRAGRKLWQAFPDSDNATPVFSSDSRLLVFKSSEEISLWDVQARKLIVRTETLDARTRDENDPPPPVPPPLSDSDAVVVTQTYRIDDALVFSDDNTRLYGWTPSGRIITYDIAQRRWLEGGHTGLQTISAVSPGADRSTLLIETEGEAGAVAPLVVYNVDTRRIERTYKPWWCGPGIATPPLPAGAAAPTSPPSCIGWPIRASSDGRRIAIAGRADIRVYDPTRDGDPVFTVARCESGDDSCGYTEPAYAPARNLMAFERDDRVIIVDTMTGKELRQLTQTGGRTLFELEFSADGSRLIGQSFGESDQYDYWVWDAETGSLLGKAGPVPSGTAWTVQPSGRQFMFEHDNGDMEFWQALGPMDETLAQAMRRVCAIRPAGALVLSELDMSMLPDEAPREPDLCKWPTTPTPATGGTRAVTATQ